MTSKLSAFENILVYLQLSDDEEFRKYLGINTETYQVPIPCTVHFNCYNFACYILKNNFHKLNQVLSMSILRKQKSMFSSSLFLAVTLCKASVTIN